MWLPKELITALSEANARDDEDDDEEFPKRVESKQYLFGVVNSHFPILPSFCLFLYLDEFMSFLFVKVHLYYFLRIILFWMHERVILNVEYCINPNGLTVLLQ